ncbi:hemerythrin domain-containing protein [Runella salmonicolor]|uniref:Hemerythrin domain-containing protein n=1 Tax=Runella salmonicolor TaxID=2950278 RepID=A0ABT1FJY6_9BACT|nr:hemerythrin domain-containing protein [Runella salmonicolor]MCP1382059.1 hemerythrin domain-containing protein [Runella salmonicolor]
MTAINEFIDSEKVHQLVLERFEVKPSNQPGMVAGELHQTMDMDPELVELIQDLYTNSEGFPFEKMYKFSLEEILTYLQATHRYYLMKKLPEIEQSLVDIFSKYSESYQLLASLAYFFNNYKAKLIDHIRFEEKDLFPYIQLLIKASKGVQNTLKLASNPDFSICGFMEAHACIEDELEQVSTLIKRYSGNQALPLPYKIFLNQVELFEMELRKHAIIEDHVLVPMALELERNLN